jgi:hypothetical protein
MTREQMIDEAVRRVKGDRRWRLFDDAGMVIVETPWRGSHDSLFPLIRAEFARLAAGEGWRD